MPTKNTSEIKEKILFTLRRRGPSLPVHIANETKLSMLFASAFLSELFSEKKIKMSHMRVGNSPLYFISGQEYMLEKFSGHLKSRDKDAFFILKEKEFLEDSKQEPAIRVALRQIKDFAKPFKFQEKIIWRYFKISEENFKKEVPILKNPEKTLLKEDHEFPKEFINDVKENFEKSKNEEEKELNIFNKEPGGKISIKKSPKKKVSQKKNEKFFNKVKEYLSKNSIEILDIESFNKNELVLKVKEKEEGKFLFAFNKKRISETDITKSYKKALDANLRYIIMSLSEPSKKLSTFIKAIKNLSKIEKLE